MSRNCDVMCVHSCKPRSVTELFCNIRYSLFELKRFDSKFDSSNLNARFDSRFDLNANDRFASLYLAANMKFSFQPLMTFILPVFI